MNKLEAAYSAACEAREKAYAPYSKFLVGAAVKIKDSDTLYTGCNVENASYGATVCAERVALFSMVAERGSPTVEYMVLVTDTDPASVPCGQCLQVMAEFLQPETPIHLANLSGIQSCRLFKELLPSSFDFPTR